MQYNQFCPFNASKQLPDKKCWKSGSIQYLHTEIFVGGTLGWTVGATKQKTFPQKTGAWLALKQLSGIVILTMKMFHTWSYDPKSCNVKHAVILSQTETFLLNLPICICA